MPTQLLVFIYDDNFVAAETLLRSGGGKKLIDVPDEDGMLPIHAVTDFSAYDELSVDVRASLHSLAILLIENGAKLDIAHEGLLPIHYVCAHKNGSLAVLRAILNKGFDPNVQDTAGETALHHAIKAGESHKSIIEELLKRSDLKMLKTIEQFTPLDYARKYYPAVAGKIEEYQRKDLDVNPQLMLMQYQIVKEQPRVNIIIADKISEDKEKGIVAVNKKVV